MFENSFKAAVMTFFDFFVLNKIQLLFGNDFLNAVMPSLTRIGDGGAVWLVIAAGMMFFEKTRRTGILMVIALLIGAIFGNLILKPLIERLRPCVVQLALAVLAPCVSGYSFPSGHALSSFAAAGVLYFTHTKLAWAAVVLAAIIAFSRLYLFFHFPSDIVGGAVLGAAIAYAVVLSAHKKAGFNNRLLKH